jgi:hypothetical protein
MAELSTLMAPRSMRRSAISSTGRRPLGDPPGGPVSRRLLRPLRRPRTGHPLLGALRLQRLTC